MFTVNVSMEANGISLPNYISALLYYLLYIENVLFWSYIFTFKKKKNLLQEWGMKNYYQYYFTVWM